VFRVTTPPRVDPAAGDPVAALVEALRALGGTVAICDALLTSMPGIDGVGLTVFTAAGRFVVGTGGVHSEQVEDLQITLDQGPCMDAYRSGEPVLVSDLAGPEASRQWPGFAPHAMTAGLRGLFAFPVLIGRHPIAVLDLCRTLPGPLADSDHDQAALHAAAATILLHDDAHTRDAESQGAAVTAAVANLQQATGMIMVQANVDARTALHRLRGHAFTHGRPVRDVVAEVLDHRLRFDPTTAS